jgi:hypothetical protein
MPAVTTYLTRLTFLILCLISSSINSIAQLSLPQVSPPAKVYQRVGLTDITISYYRPSARGRVVFGELVPIGQLWRTGANNNTLIRFSDEVQIGGESVPAGTYSLFSIPKAGAWTIILNKDTTLWGTEKYSAASDLVRFEVPSAAHEFAESFTVQFTNLKYDGCNLELSWERTGVKIPIQTDVDRQINEALDNGIKNNQANWQLYAQAAHFYIQQNRKHEQALTWINQSLELDKHAYNTWLKAKLLAQKEEYREAVSLANQALKMPLSDGSTPVSQTDVKEAIEQWKRRMNLQR